jgi:hypothetical protein
MGCPRTGRNRPRKNWNKRQDAKPFAWVIPYRMMPLMGVGTSL